MPSLSIVAAAVIVSPFASNTSQHFSRSIVRSYSNSSGSEYSPSDLFLMLMKQVFSVKQTIANFGVNNFRDKTD